MSETLKVKVKRLTPTAQLPRYATPGAACFDLVCDSIEEAAVRFGEQIDGGLVYAGLPVTCGTGLALEIPEGHVMLVFSRSGHGFKSGVSLANCVGVIDSDYRGEVKVKLQQAAWAREPMSVRVGDRIAQAMVLPIPAVELIDADELSDTDRGAGGFGSTGG